MKSPDELVEKMAAHKRKYEGTIKQLRSDADASAATSRLTLKVTEDLAESGKKIILLHFRHV